MKKLFLTVTIFLSVYFSLLGGSEPSTYFNIFVPPNNDAVGRNVALVVTAIHDSTHFEIIDDPMDGDSDDSVSGILNAGQSYILYIKDNGINDDAYNNEGFVQKQDGDYFKVKSDKLVYASISTDSDWQHDFVPGVNKKSVGQKFIVYAPKSSSSTRDLNVFAYEENTTITVLKVSQSSTTSTGYTNVDLNNKETVIQRTLNPGEDIIYLNQDGRNLMNSGETYMIEANRDVSIQYGALHGNERDGGAYVPSRNGSSSGELFYFAVPYQSGGEQEIRVVSWEDENDIVLERYSNGSWIELKSWHLNTNEPGDWVGKQDGNMSYQTVFRVSCTTGKKISVFEANWMETGYTSTSDMASMVSSSNGTSSGTTFLMYLLPPGAQNNVLDPFSGDKFNNSYSHIYLFAGKNASTVTVKDAKTNGLTLTKTFNIEAGRYADATFSIEEWKSIYNGTGQPTGDERPYVLVESTNNISVLSTNFNDNWMTYFGSSLPQSFSQQSSNLINQGIPGDTLSLASFLSVDADTVKQVNVELQLGSGVIPIESILTNNSNNTKFNGDISIQENQSTITFDNVPDITAGDNYQIDTKLVLSSSFNDGQPIDDGTVISVETVVTGVVDEELQQSIISQGIENNASNSTNLLFSVCDNNISLGGDNWNAAWIDTNNDGFEDLIVPDKNEDSKGQYYQNVSGVLNPTTPKFLQKGLSVSIIWADVDNDGFSDALVVNATGKQSLLYRNNGSNNFTPIPNSGVAIHPQYFHGAAFSDFDNDGLLDLLITNFFPTKFHHLYRNKGDFSFEKIEHTVISSNSSRSLAPILSDYNQDGLVDVFIPNGNDEPNSLFRNMGGFKFEAIINSPVTSDQFNSVGAAWGDYDGDGDQDLYVVNASAQHNNLYQNNGDGTFNRITQGELVQEKGHSHGASWVDVDNDADLDLYVTNDQGNNRLYINQGNGTFLKKMDEAIAGNTGRSYGAAWADYNQDGAMDVFISNHDGDNSKLFCHNGLSRNWISFKLKGTKSNSAGIGASVSVKADGVWQMRELLPVSGFGSQNSMRLHFGIGSAVIVDTVIVRWPSGIIQKLYSLPVNNFQAIQETAAIEVPIVTFHDQNLDGVMNDGENPVGNVSLKLSIGQVVRTDSKGHYNLTLNEGIYQLEAIYLENWGSDGPLEIVVNSSVDTTYYFPLSQLNTGHDLSVNFHTTAWRRGFLNETLIHLDNSGTQKATNVTVRLNYPKEVYVKSSEKEFNSFDNHQYEWVLDEICQGERLSIVVTDSVGLDAFVGQLLKLSATVNAEGLEVDTTNNHSTSELEVVGAIDPNDLIASPKGDGEEGYISKDQWLTYTIRFENIGSYYASYVFLNNTLSRYLDEDSFEVINSSHPYTYTLSEGELEVRYDNILLPSAKDDEQGSQGYFTYRIKPSASLYGGETIYNSVAITFDFELPIYTNTTKHTIKLTGDNRIHQLKIYPNPAVTSTKISLDEEFIKYEEFPVIQILILRDNNGRIMYRESEVNEHTMDLMVNQFDNGLYFIEAIDQYQTRYQGKLIVR